MRSVTGERQYAFSITTDHQIPFGLSQPEFTTAGFQKEVEEERTVLDKRADEHVHPSVVTRPLWLEVHVWGGGSERETRRPFYAGSLRPFWVAEMILENVKVLPVGLSRRTTSPDVCCLFPLREGLSNPQVRPWPLCQDLDMSSRMPAGCLYVAILQALPTAYFRSPWSFLDLTFCDSTQSGGSEKLTFPWRRLNINEEQRNPVQEAGQKEQRL